MARKLLLADDSITIQKVVELVLAEEDFTIKAVSNGEDAVSVLTSFKPDIVLADVDMPKINGYQLCEKVKANPATKDVPVILLSGAFEPLDEELAKQVKADSYVVKPFESQELISKINAALISPATEAKPAAAEAGGEVIAEAVSTEEDLWAAEEIIAEPVGVEEAEGEALAAEEAETIEEAVLPEMSFAEEEIKLAEEKEKPIIQPFVEQTITPQPKSARPSEKAAAPVTTEIGIKMPEISLPSNEEMLSIFRESMSKKIDEFFSNIDLRDMLFSVIKPSLKESVERLLWEIAPEITDKLVKEIIQSSLSSLGKEVEKVIWETVPEIAETMIAKEIEKIKSEM